MEPSDPFLARSRPRSFPAYAGVGSRETPADALDLMTQIAALAHEAGWRLRSGGAPGADQAFAAASPGAETYLGWPSYEHENLRALLLPPLRVLTRPTEAALATVERWHPAPDKLGRGGRALHARNAHIVFGRRLDDPVEAIICWTVGGRVSGGTGGALRMAADYDIPVYNLGSSKDLPSAAEVVAWMAEHRSPKG